jgi:hypothetical protein
MTIGGHSHGILDIVDLREPAESSGALTMAYTADARVRDKGFRFRFCACGSTADIMVSGKSPHTPTSAVLNELLRAAPAEFVTLGWLVGRLGRRSFGVVLLLLGLLGLLPGVSILAAILLLVAAFEMALANRRPVFTRRLAALRFPTRRLATLIRRAVPALKYLERFIRPR